MYIFSMYALQELTGPSVACMYSKTQYFYKHHRHLKNYKSCTEVLIGTTTLFLVSY